MGAINNENSTSTGGRRERPTAHAGPCVDRHPGTGWSTQAPHGLNTRHPGPPQGMMGTSPTAVAPPCWHGRNVRSEWPVAENAKQHIKMNLISGNSASLSSEAPDFLESFPLGFVKQLLELLVNETFWFTMT